MRTILVPTDFSKHALQALEFAIEISSAYKATIKVMHVVELPSTSLMDYPFHGEVIKEMKKQAEVYYSTWVNEVSDKSSIVEFEAVQDDVVPAIEKCINEESIDLVVMGTQGRSGLSELFVGSNTEKIVRRSKVPVFSVKKSIKADAIKHIIFPSELALNETRLVENVKHLQSVFNARLHIVYVNTPVAFKREGEINALMKDYIDHYRFKNYSTHLVSDMYEYAGIMAYSNEFDGVLIALGTHSRKGLAHFFRGSIAEDLINHEQCPIWTLSLKSGK